MKFNVRRASHYGKNAYCVELNSLEELITFIKNTEDPNRKNGVILTLADKTCDYDDFYLENNITIYDDYVE